MTNLHIHTASRACAVCGKELTDAVSINEGIGPWCRHKANEVLAKEIPADLDAAAEVVAKITQVLPSVHETARPTLALALAEINAGLTLDWRETVKRLAWVASWKPTDAVKALVVELVAALGYIGFAGLLTQEASTGEARAFLHEGRVHLEGPRNKAGATAIKANVKGYKFHAAGSIPGVDKATWSAPVASFEAFSKTTQTYWPLITGLAAVAEQIALLGDVVETTPEAPKAVVTFEDGKVGWFVLRSPKNWNFVNALKCLHYKDRAWNPTLTAWEVRTIHAKHVATLVKEHYGVAPTLLGSLSGLAA